MRADTTAEEPRKKSFISRTDIGLLALITLFLTSIYPVIDSNIVFIRIVDKDCSTHDFVKINDTLTASMFSGSIEIKNTSIKSGHIRDINISPCFINPQSQLNEEIITTSISYIDRREIYFMETKQIKFSVIFYFRNIHTIEQSTPSRSNIFQIEYYDDNNHALHIEDGAIANFYVRPCGKETIYDGKP